MKSNENEHLNRMLLLISLLITVQLSALSVSAQGCLTYEPDRVVLQGTIRRHTFAGPPNYESVARGDASEDVWVLHLPKPILVSASSDWQKESHVTELQLVFAEGRVQYDKYRPLLGQGVRVTGTLFQRHTGHHHTRVLLTVASIKKK